MSKYDEMPVNYYKHGSCTYAVYGSSSIEYVGKLRNIIKEKYLINNTKHPMQPLVIDAHNVIRFKENKIVSYLLGDRMNEISIKGFSQEDREQFAQLIGYSVCEFCDLSYTSDEARDAAWEDMEELQWLSGFLLNNYLQV